MLHVLFVCLGNICRSPLAQGIMEKRIREEGLVDHIAVDSCGTSRYHIGEQPDERTLKNAFKNGLELNHRARQFAAEDFDQFDYIIVMDNANMDAVRRLNRNAAYLSKLYLMRDFDPENKGADVPDPYFGGEAGFQHAYDIIERSVNAFLDHVVKRHHLKG